MAYCDFNNVTRRTASDKILRDKTFYFDKNSKHDGYQRELALIAYSFFFDKKTVGGAIKNEIISIENLQKNFTNQLLEHLRKEKYTHLL